MNQDEDMRAVAREDLCRFLAACYYEPGPEFLEEDLFGSLRRAAAVLDPELGAAAQRLGEVFARESQEALLLDYTRLFLGPIGARARPYGSVWLERNGTLLGESTLAVVELYREAGFEITEDFRELPDHVAAELEFLYMLNFRVRQTRQAGDAASLVAVQDVRRRFLDAHLARWIAPFADAAEAGAESAFYRGLAALTRRVVELESGGPRPQ